MATATFYIKQNDTLPVIKAVLKDASGNIVDLGNASGIRFHLSTSKNVNLIDAEAGMEGNGSTGVALYNWVIGNTALAGSFKAEFEVTFTGGGIETFPNNSFISVVIEKELA